MTVASPPIPDVTPIRDHRALVAIDLGAESCRVSLLRWIEPWPVINLVHRFSNAPRVTANGLRWDLRAIEAGVDEGLRKCAALATEGVRAIAIDGWAVDYVRIDAEGRPIGDPYCYRDERTIAAEASLHRCIAPERMRAITGVQLSRINTLYQLKADSAEVVDLPWLNLPEYILYRLGARPVAELTNASHTQLVDLKTRTWSEEIFAAAGIPLGTAPEFVPPGTIVGQLRGPLAELPAFADTALIAPATHDTASAIAGIPATGDDWAYISSGTWSLVGTVLDAPENDAASQVANFTNLAAAGDRILFHKSVNGMWLLRQCIEHWSFQGTTWPISELVAAAERICRPTSLLEVDEPDLMLPGQMPRRINEQRRRRGLPIMEEVATNAPAFASLIFHSLAARYAEVLSDIEKQTGKTLRRIYVVGGASRNEFLNRLTEKTTGMQVIRGPQESSTVGNFAIQLATLESALRETFRDEIHRWATILAGKDFC